MHLNKLSSSIRSPLSKVFIDGLNKTDKKEGLLKRLKNIESTNQLLAHKIINKPAIRGSDDDINNEYKKITEDLKIIK